MTKPSDPDVDETDDFADGSASRIVVLLDEYLEQQKAGAAPDRDAFLAANPDHAGQLRACLASLDFISHSHDKLLNKKELGDFRIVRELGQGGMGTVYEAEQVSLGRRVALKIIRSGRQSQESVDRFHREAETIATLHHTNIVPIFAIGVEEGINYFAMQYIDGQSLAEVMRESHMPFDSAQVAEWGIDVAEALAHAHERGVVHRDVKPSNLLLDKDGRIWLSDFGLAKRDDDLTLSVTGAVLGTPRYMSPEQARGITEEVDHRTDIYSLGATLYELATKAPVVEGSSPHEIMGNICHDVPTPLGERSQRIPADFDTIVMQCLERHPGDRYATAESLAEDLRAFSEGRPISAQRMTRLERGIRWVRQQRDSVTFTAYVVLLTLLAALLVLVGDNLWRVTQQATLHVSSRTEGSVTEFLDESGDTIRPPVSLPTHEEISLPRGEVLLRTSAPGRLSQTVRAYLAAGPGTNRGHSGRHLQVGLEQQLIGDPIAVERSYAMSPSSGQILLLNQDGIVCFDPVRNKRIWSSTVGDWKEGMNSKGDEYIGALDWDWNRSTGTTEFSGFSIVDMQPIILEDSIDLDGDGVVDIVVAARHQAWVLALSGKDGAALWIYAPPCGSSPTPPSGTGRSCGTLGKPLLIADVNKNGTRDLSIALVDASDGVDVPAKSWVQTLDGRTGKPIWRYDVPPIVMPKVAGTRPQDIPPSMVWFASGFASYKAPAAYGGVVNSAALRRTVRDVGTEPQLKQGEYVLVPQPPQLAELSGKQHIAIAAGSQLHLVDETNGSVVKSLDFAGTHETEHHSGSIRRLPYVRPRILDLDNDGNSEVVLTLDCRKRNVSGAWDRLESVGEVWSLRNGQRISSQTVPEGARVYDQRGAAPIAQVATADRPTWPLCVDLDNDGDLETISPEGQFATHESEAGIAVANPTSSDAANWTRRLKTSDQHIERFLPGPDINADGCRDVFVATIWGRECFLYVEALSGVDGTSLWTSSHRLNSEAEAQGSQATHFLASLKWWQVGVATPQLLVTTHTVETQSSNAVTVCFDAASGDVRHVGRQMPYIEVADVDGDQLDDLVVFRPHRWARQDTGGTITLIRGSGQEVWHAAGANQIATMHDLNGDGVEDIVQTQYDDVGDQYVSATCSVTGGTIWRIRDQLRGHLMFSFAPVGQNLDVDLDGTQDLLMSSLGFSTRPLMRAISGRTGKVLWTCPATIAEMLPYQGFRLRDLDGDGQPEIVLIGVCELGRTPPLKGDAITYRTSRLQIFVLNSRSGRVEWKKELSPMTGNFGLYFYAKAFDMTRPELLDVDIHFADGNGDGVLDVITPVDTGAWAFIEWQMLDGNNGTPIWTTNSKGMDTAVRTGATFSLSPIPRLNVGDLDADGVPEIVEVTSLVRSKGIPMAVIARDLRDGSVRWKHVLGDCREKEWNRSLRRVRPAPLVVKAGGQRFVVVNAGKRLGDVTVLDASGRLVETLPSGKSSLGNELRTVQLQGSESVVLAGASVRLIQPGKSPIVRWEHADGRDATIVRVVNASEGDGGQVVVRMRGTNSEVLGIDLSSGKTIWSCPIEDDGQVEEYFRDIEVAINPTAPILPLVVQKTGQTHAVCRTSAWRTGAPRPQSASKLTRKNRPIQKLARDRRYAMPLPWSPAWMNYRNSNYILHRGTNYFGWGFFNCATLLVVPWLIVRQLGRRRWSLRVLLLVPVAVAIVLAGARAYPDQSIISKLVSAVAFVPILIYVGRFFGLLVFQQWKRLGWLVSVTLGLTGLLAAGFLAGVSFSGWPESRSYYVLDDWWWILLYGVYVTGLALVAWFSFRWFLASRRNIA